MGIIVNIVASLLGIALLIGPTVTAVIYNIKTKSKITILVNILLMIIGLILEGLILRYWIHGKTLKTVFAVLNEYWMYNHSIIKALDILYTSIFAISILKSIYLRIKNKEDKRYLFAILVLMAAGVTQIVRNFSYLPPTYEDARDTYIMERLIFLFYRDFIIINFFVSNFFKDKEKNIETHE